MVVAGSIASDFATGLGLTAAAIGIGGFLAHANPALSGASDARLREATVTGGLGGLAFAAFVMVLSAVVG